MIDTALLELNSRLSLFVFRTFRTVIKRLSTLDATRSKPQHGPGTDAFQTRARASIICIKSGDVIYIGLRFILPFRDCKCDPKASMLSIFCPNVR